MGVSYGKDYQYAAEKVSGSYVSKDGYPVYIHNINVRTGLVTYANMGSAIARECNLSDLDLTPLRFGYVNYFNRACYLARLPQRVFRQGAREGSCRIYYQGRFERCPNFDGHVANTVLGIYPSVEDCVETVLGDTTTSQAFNRKFAIRKTKKDKLLLLYKEREVGEVDDNCKCKLSDNTKYLTESLDEALKR